jgi:hypothetical protein
MPKCNLATSAALNTYLVSYRPKPWDSNANRTSRALYLGLLAGLEVMGSACNRMRAELVNLAVFLALP